MGWSKLWEDAEQQVHSALPMAFITDRTAELLHTINTIFSAIADQMSSPDPTWEAAGMRDYLVRRRLHCFSLYHLHSQAIWLLKKEGIGWTL